MTLNTSFHPGEPWLDTDGKPIQAHGGCMLYDNGIYYWFGENKDGENYLDQSKGFLHRVDVIGVSCYSSTDLLNWKNEGIVLPAEPDNPDSDLHPSKVFERPKVIRNPKTGKYILFAHADTADYKAARIGIAISDTPAGRYQYLGSIQPNGNDSRDMTVFQDDDGAAYLFFSSEWNKTLHIIQLDDEYLHPTQNEARAFINQSREAPAVFKRDGKYFIISSGCTGWDPNQAELAVADFPLGPWTVIGDPCIGKDSEITYYAQSAFVFPLAGKKDAFIAMFDRWNKNNLRDSRYVWLPVQFNGEQVNTQWCDAWDLSIFDHHYFQEAHMTTDQQNEWETHLQLSNENIARHRQGQARLRFVSSNGEPLKHLPVQVTQKTQDFLFGNLIFDLLWGDPPYKPDLFKQRFLELFNLAIFPFYWSYYEPKPGQTQWQKMLPVLEWCRANGVTPKGHPLVWPYTAGVPEWLYDMPEGTVEPLIKARVTSLVKNLEHEIGIWDVTNEAVNHISWAEGTHPNFKKRYHEIDLWRGIEVSSAFKREISIPEVADWVEDSFRWAYAANPKATLLVNDYNQEFDLHIRQRFYDLIVELKKRGTPVSGLGLQVHPINHWLYPHEMWDTLEMYRELEIPIHITELSQPSWEQPIEGGFRDGKWSPQAQADFIEQMYRQCFGHPSVVSINYWGLSDRGGWIQGGGLIDEEYRPKPVFEKLKQLIKGEWLTHPFTASTDENGEIAFKGFYGNYELVLPRTDQQHRTFNFHLSANKESNVIFKP